MKIEFLDGSQIDVITIFGGPRLINGVMRDTLNIEVSPETIGFEELKAHFNNNPKTSTLYSYTEEQTGDGIALQKNKIGDGYNIFVSITDETRRQQTPPGVLAPDVMENVYIVTISQMTYQEYQDFIAKSSS